MTTPAILPGGPRMRAVVAYAGLNPGCTKADAGRGGTTGPLYYGSVERAIRRGYLTATRRTDGRYQLHQTKTGAQFAAQQPRGTAK